MKNKDFIMYTYMHRIAFKYVVEQLIKDEYEREQLLERAKWHDLDKQFLYFLTDKATASEYHRSTSAHHMGNSPYKTDIDILEAIMDYECAGYTKADKPRNAYDTVRELKPDHYDELMDTMKKLGICKSYRNIPSDSKWKANIKDMQEITLEMAFAEVAEWVIDNPVEARKAMDYLASR